MNQEDLWIGDRVKLVKSGRIGIYEGMSKNEKAKVKIGQKIIFTTYENLVKAKEQINQKIIELKPEKMAPLSSASFKEELDLHIEILAPELIHQIPQLILSRQLNACRQYVEKAIHLKVQNFVIIHGVGAGHLKTEVNHILKMYQEIKDIALIHNGGATKVTLEYFR